MKSLATTAIHLTLLFSGLYFLVQVALGHRLVHENELRFLKRRAGMKNVTPAMK